MNDTVRELLTTRRDRLNERLTGVQVEIEEAKRQLESLMGLRDYTTKSIADLDEALMDAAQESIA